MAALEYKVEFNELEIQRLSESCGRYDSTAPPLRMFYEFFSGAGMVRAGLGEQWHCLFANDWNRKKALTYYLNWGDMPLRDDVRDITADDLPGNADLAWASFPCQDLSLAGAGAGLKGERSGTFWSFWDIMTALNDQDRPPSVIVIENVCGTLTSHEGKDFATICRALQDGGYRFGALIVDAVLFVPQSRPRLFIVAVKENIEVHNTLAGDSPRGEFHTRTLIAAYSKLPYTTQESWIWWKAETPPSRRTSLADIIEGNPTSVSWHTQEETLKLLDMMSDVNLKKVDKAKCEGRLVVGTGYKRTRRDEFGRKLQRAEIRFDGVAGCLRTPAGGSSRQLVIVVDGQQVRSRLLSSRESARLMGLSDNYVLPDNYNETYHLTGDGVVVPVVRFLSSEIFEPMLAHAAKRRSGE